MKHITSPIIKNGLLAACLLSASAHGFAQSTFTYSLERDLLPATAALGIGLASFLVDNEPDSLPGTQDRAEVNPFDRPFMFSYNKPLDYVSDYGVYGMLLLPALSALPNVSQPGTLLTYGIMYAEAFFLTAGTKNLLKNAIIRYRPYLYADGIPFGKETDYDNSFPSGSTAYAFLSAGFLSATYTSEFPESRWKIPVVAGSYALATGVASLRILSGSHFLTDVLTGAAIGTLYGWLIPVLHKTPRATPRPTIHLTSTSITLTLKL
ncbi:MAG: phosphatase PAP2 family protein [Spirochaetaceae bacterium]|jgi:membrane-associated phospholipid phosphatase|nr:phosphatase PAP2 family protein [Spirochaetaceae bacterium]